MTDQTPQYVYKILSAEDWAKAQALGVTQTALDEGDGYVHLSTRAQVGETLSLHYRGQDGAQLLEFALEGLTGDLKWEHSRGGQLFPHLYTPLKIGEAKRIWALNTGSDGVPTLPKDL